LLVFEVLVGGDRRAARGGDLGHDVVRDRRGPAAPLGLDACVVDAPRRAAGRECARIGGTEPAAGPGDERDPIVEPDHAALSAAAVPARRPKTVHSSRLLPIIRLRPWVPPAISPQAKRPGSVVSPCSSITRPPFW